jgi:hypothetical protein
MVNYRFLKLSEPNLRSRAPPATRGRGLCESGMRVAAHHHLHLHRLLRIPGEHHPPIDVLNLPPRHRVQQGIARLHRLIGSKL